MRATREAVRADHGRMMAVLDRHPHAPEDLAAETGLDPDHLEPRIGELQERGWVERWGDRDPVLALTWRGRWAYRPRRFRAAALASLGLGVATAAAVAGWAAVQEPLASAPDERWAGAALALGLAAAVLLAAAAWTQWIAGR